MFEFREFVLVILKLYCTFCTSIGPIIRHCKNSQDREGSTYLPSSSSLLGVVNSMILFRAFFFLFLSLEFPELIPGMVFFHASRVQLGLIIILYNKARYQSRALPE